MDDIRLIKVPFDSERRGLKMQNIAKIDIIGLRLRVISRFTVFHPNPRRKKISLLIVFEIRAIDCRSAKLIFNKCFSGRSRSEKEQINLSSHWNDLIGEWVSWENESQEEKENPNDEA